MNDNIKAILSNPFTICIVLLYAGFISLSFLGEDNKSVRIITIVLIWIVVLSNKSELNNSDPILSCLKLYVISCFPSFLFTDNPSLCAFKLFELILLPVFANLGISFFHINEKLIVPKILLFYYIFQTLIAVFGYFLDPTTIAVDTGYGAYVTFLHCNYPPIQSNALGSYCAFSLLVCTYLVARELKDGYRIVNLSIYTILFTLSCFTMYLCSSRTSMISCLIAFLFLFINIFKAKTKTIVIVASLALAGVYVDKVAETAYSIIMKKQTESTIDKSDDAANQLSSGRLAMWEKAIEDPTKCILGQGFGTGFREMQKNGDTFAGNAHNSVVEILYNAGIFALFFWLRLWYLLYKRFKYFLFDCDGLPLDRSLYYLTASICILAVIRSIGNLSFVYLQLDSFAPLAAIILCVYTSNYQEEIEC